MATVNDLIIDALRQISAIDITETPEAAVSQDALNVMNDILEQWRIDGLMVYSVSRSEFNLSAGQNVYTLGNGGDWNIERPERIVFASAKDSGGNEIPVEVTDVYDRYAAIISKTGQSTLPLMIYDDNNYPLKNIYVFPVPSSGAYTMVLWYWKRVEGFTAVTDVVNLPDGYKPALQDRLALELAPRYGKPVTPSMEKKSANSEMMLERMNMKIPLLIYPSDLPNRSPFNWITGDSY